jgi:hypothetical protein
VAIWIHIANKFCPVSEKAVRETRPISSYPCLRAATGFPNPQHSGSRSNMVESDIQRRYGNPCARVDRPTLETNADRNHHVRRVADIVLGTVQKVSWPNRITLGSNPSRRPLPHLHWLAPDHKSQLPASCTQTSVFRNSKASFVDSSSHLSRNSNDLLRRHLAHYLKHPRRVMYGHSEVEHRLKPTYPFNHTARRLPPRRHHPLE